ncbi:MAG: TraB/GumN family protein [Neptuniibacter caesariensis]|uniref:TraB/GumN family protein n=1 Tax=Neptuniibacter caesariensis TaxID=207954 RepID=A0A2G6JQ22_NEPCE|nr:MAG: TraB/GumN family protein [Neptuniibacter caesariensis]
MSKTRKVLFGFLGLLISSQLFADTTLWRVSGHGNHLYLGGTIHMLAPEDLPFPKAFDDAFDQSDEVVLETDIAKLLDPGVQTTLMSKLSYQDGRLLNQVISPQLYADLTHFLQERQLMPHLFIGMKPAGVTLTILAIEFQRLGISESGADRFYSDKALAAGKPVSGLETIAEHLRFISEMGEGNEERFLRQTLDDIEKTEKVMRSMVAAWKAGDVETLQREVIADMRQSYPKVYNSLLVERNQRWYPQIKEMLNTEKVELVLVGAAHLIGPEGILEMLRKQGYEIEQL